MNGPERHAIRVLKGIGIHRSFEAIFDIAPTGYQPKPNPKAFESFRTRYSLDVDQAAMFEDQSKIFNIQAVRGVTCILIGESGNAPDEHIHICSISLKSILRTLSNVL